MKLTEIDNRSKAKRFREMLAQEEIIQLPGAHNALTARIIEKTGFKGVYITGSGTASAMLGAPDVGLVTFTEMFTNVKYINNAVNIPVICDADTGYGNSINVMRTVREYEEIGVAGIHIEDQLLPKKCGHMEGKQLVTAEEMVGKIQAALAARQNPDFVIIARTDARAVLGIEEAIRRANLYVEAGADVIFPEAPQSKEELKLFAEEIQAPIIANMTEWGKTPLCTLDELRAMGCKIVIYPASGMRAAHKAIEDLMVEIMTKGTQKDFLDHLTPRRELYDLVELPKINEMERKY